MWSTQANPTTSVPALAAGSDAVAFAVAAASPVCSWASRVVAVFSSAAAYPNPMTNLAITSLGLHGFMTRWQDRLATHATPVRFTAHPRPGK